MPNVTVNVSSIGVVSCTPDPVRVSGSNATITFNLANADYSFAATNAIVVPQPASQFPNPATTVSANTATLFDANTDSNHYKYVVHLVKNSDNEPLSFDPTIENGY
ncbi:hypothetical protein [Ideonella sp.]|uniref:hypothetical protein n=1 Tax=Ideonella sp. TaxID=1929293 RepID=UPI002B492AA7|nr:hypothetical protein [Ideonella sp.]HJV71281.1 hypothetical protein [Ideonella sp.]